MNLQLADTVAVVVGGAEGIGRAIAEEFASEGARVGIVDRNPQVADTAEEVGASRGVAARGVVADVTDFAAVQSAAAEVASELGTPEAVVFAAAVGSGKFGFPFWNLQPENWPRALEVNLLGAVHVAHAFAPAMIEARRGAFLFLSSVAGQIGSQTDPPYSASKAALINFAQCAAKDLAPHNIRVNSLCPGMVRTRLNRSVWQAFNDRQPEELRQDYETWTAEKIARLVPLNRFQEPEDLAAMAVFLCSARGENITGQTINVDGGYVIR